MKKTLALLSLTLCGAFAFAQTKIVPGHKSIDVNLIKDGKTTMGYYVVKDGSSHEICSYEIETTTANDTLKHNSLLQFLNSDNQWKERIVLDKKTLKPISRTSERDTRNFNVQYASTIKGEYTDVKTGKKSLINASVDESYFDIATYPLVICALPLTTGYKAIIPVIDFDAPIKDKIYNVNIIEVKSNVYSSTVTGEHQIWRVGVVEESTGNVYAYDIDKETRKIYKIGVSSKGNTLMLVNKETDFNPFKNKFDKEATLKMVTQGNSVILGETFARDDRSGRDDRKLRIDVLNVNKKQFAPKGTKVLLIPYTAYYKEWLELNKKQSKIKGAKPIPLPEEAKACIRTTEVYNDKGNFEFANLTEGEYLLYTSFSYEDTYSKREVTGYGDVYVNGQYTGTEEYSSMFTYGQQGNANFTDIVNIKTNGETVKIKLKR